MARGRAIVAAVTLLLAGCGGGTKLAGPPPSAQALLRGSLAAAARSPGAQYELHISAVIHGTLPKQFQHFGRPRPNFRAGGRIGRDGFTAQIRSSIPEIAVFTGDEVVAGPRFAYLRYRGTWYGTHARGLTDVWSQLGRLLAPGAAAQAIHGAVRVGHSRDGVDTWALTGRPDARVLGPLVRVVAGTLAPRDLTRIARRSQAVYEVGVDDRLPRRLLVDIDLRRPDLPLRIARQLPLVTDADVTVELVLTKWGEPSRAIQPAPARSFGEYRRLVGLGR